ncbi:FAD-dependent oxidoreductase [Novosphingobium profundi]|uniref:FAD-dependent oxidoreductase n=1 Tax=Novosphingobium profundi TaxID=1774954 RepID=UPI001CFCB94D|nr:FAD-dependent oxidoreductase [Novosphingobium profundi]
MAEHWDIAIIGGGTAGLPAAITAARGGARVILVEAAEELGGTLHLTGGSIAGSGTKAQAAKGIEDSAERHYRDCLTIGGRTAQDDVLRLWTDNAGATIDWLYGEGVPFGEQMPTFSAAHEAYDAPRTFTPPRGGKDLVDTLVPMVLELVAQGRIELRLATRMTALACDATGAVVGVEVCRADGSQTTLRADNVVLACGGYGANAALWERLHPGTPYRTYAWPTCRGDGHLAAEAAGAILAHAQNFLPTYGASEDIDAPGTFWIHSMVAPSMRAPWEINVNMQAQRFMREDLPSPDGRERALRAQPGQAFWTIYDARIRAEAPPLFRWEPEKVARAFAQSPDFVEAASVSELAAKCGLDAATLEATIAAYNEGQQSGEDAFGREHMPCPIAQAPFYAVRHVSTSVVTWGGITVDGELRVTDADGAPIPGLYAAGEVLGMGVFGAVFLGGSTMSSALTFGRLLGERLSAAAATASPTHIAAQSPA